MSTDTQAVSGNVPTEKVLREVFGQVVGAWANLTPQDSNQQFRVPAGAVIERKVILSGPTKFHLVVRIPREFGLIMGRLFSQGADAASDPEDAFAEVVNMYCGHLKKAIWGTQSSYTTHLPEKSDIQNWPKHDADVNCTFRVGAFPVEILVWNL
jgi:hypothetical protein